MASEQTARRKARVAARAGAEQERRRGRRPQLEAKRRGMPQQARYSPPDRLGVDTLNLARATGRGFRTCKAPSGGRAVCLFTAHMAGVRKDPTTHSHGAKARAGARAGAELERPEAELGARAEPLKVRGVKNRKEREQKQERERCAALHCSARRVTQIRECRYACDACIWMRDDNA